MVDSTFPGVAHPDDARYLSYAVAQNLSAAEHARAFSNLFPFRTYAQYVALNPADHAGEMSFCTTYGCFVYCDGTYFLAQGVFNIFSGAPSDTITGSTSEQVFRGILIPSKILGNRWSVEANGQFNVLTAAAGFSPKMRIGTTSTDLTGMAHYGPSAGTNNNTFAKVLCARTDSIVTSGGGAAVSGNSSLTSGGVSSTGLTVTNDLYIVLSASLANGAQSCSFNGGTFKATAGRS